MPRPPPRPQQQRSDSFTSTGLQRTTLAAVLGFGPHGQALFPVMKICTKMYTDCISTQRTYNMIRPGNIRLSSNHMEHLASQLLHVNKPAQLVLIPVGLLYIRSHNSFVVKPHGESCFATAARKVASTSGLDTSGTAVTSDPIAHDDVFIRSRRYAGRWYFLFSLTMHAAARER